MSGLISLHMLLPPDGAPDDVFPPVGEILCGTGITVKLQDPEQYFVDLAQYSR